MRQAWLLSLIVVEIFAFRLPLGAQQASKPIIGFLSTASAGSRSDEQFAAFEAGLRDAGFIENQNVTIEYRWASDDYAKLPTLAADLVHRRVAVIVAAGGHVAALAAHDATKEIPIVFTTVTDPVKSGLVASFNKPGGNATGTAGLTSELDAKRLELLHEIKPTASVFGVLVNPNRPGLPDQLQELQSAAAKMKLQLEIRKAASAQEIDRAFDELASLRVDALIVTADPLFNNRRGQVVSLATGLALPAIYQWREFVLAGGLMSYGPSITEAYRQAGITAARVLKGTRPADIPVVQPTKFELVINRWTANRLGLTVSPSLLSLADEVIE
jgi:putative ABC transport system substrate-binding protein